MTSQMSNWFVVRAISGQEKKVRQYIDSELTRLKLDRFVEQILIPMEKVLEMRNGKKRTRERTLFPGYIYVAFTPDSLDSEGRLSSEIVQGVKDVPGVVGFLGNERGKEPVPLRESEINAILGKVDEIEDAGDLQGVPYLVGDSVKVMDGPFNGFTGVIEEVHDDKKKLKVMVKIFGRNTPLELNYLQVERA